MLDFENTHSDLRAKTLFGRIKEVEVENILSLRADGSCYSWIISEAGWPGLTEKRKAYFSFSQPDSAAEL